MTNNKPEGNSLPDPPSFKTEPVCVAPSHDCMQCGVSVLELLGAGRMLREKMVLATTQSRSVHRRHCRCPSRAAHDAPNRLQQCALCAGERRMIFVLSCMCPEHCRTIPQRPEPAAQAEGGNLPRTRVSPGFRSAGLKMSWPRTKVPSTPLVRGHGGTMIRLSGHHHDDSDPGHARRSGLPAATGIFKLNSGPD